MSTDNIKVLEFVNNIEGDPEISDQIYEVYFTHWEKKSYT